VRGGEGGGVLLRKVCYLACNTLHTSLTGHPSPLCLFHHHQLPAKTSLLSVYIRWTSVAHAIKDAKQNGPMLSNDLNVPVYALTHFYMLLLQSAQSYTRGICKNFSCVCSSGCNRALLSAKLLPNATQYQLKLYLSFQAERQRPAVTSCE